MKEYLSTSPPAKQVSHFEDVLNALVKVDKIVSEKEQLMLDELIGMMNNYINFMDEISQCYVAIVPQHPEQENSIINLFP